ncbi:MAG: NADPH:quinone oxidoreductase family protein [Alphaproteobacteria bacterium]|nr:NADPH:quinone oxidoreductase family protein [Alphaproteobacteria bacterium]
MRAIRVHEFGGILVSEEAPAPTPGPGEVRLRVHAAGVNFADTLMIAGRYQIKPDLPFTPGIEVAGEVVELGEGVKRLSLGDRVMGAVDQGGYAEEVVAEAARFCRVPDGMDWAIAGGFPVAYGTSHMALTYRARLHPGEVLLVHGAAGGVGLTAVEIGKALGATVVAAAGTAEKCALARAHGADHAINYAEEDIRERVKELVGGADVVYDPVGGDAFMASLRCVNFEARLVIIGFASGDIPQIPANYLLVKGLTAAGFVWGAYHDDHIDVIQRSYTALGELYAAGELSPHVSHTFPLEETTAALHTVIARRSTGKVVVLMDGES